MYIVDYCEIISYVARFNYIWFNSICILLSLIANLDWWMFHLEFKSAFLYGDPFEEVIWSNLYGMLLRGRM